jgi:hypothetical protein
MQVRILERRYYNAQGEIVTDWIPQTCTNWAVSEPYEPYKGFLNTGIVGCGPYTYAPGKAAYRCEHRMQVYERKES